MPSLGRRGEVGELFFEGTNLIREDSALMTQSRPKGPHPMGIFFLVTFKKFLIEE